MVTAIVVIILGVSVAIGIAIAKGNNKLFDSGAANKSRAYDFYEQEHTFKTIVPNLDKMLNALDRGILSQEGISISISKGANNLVFRNSAGTFTASIKAAGDSKNEGVHLYKFRVNQWKERNGIIEMSARMDSNVLLTAIEKAFLMLDFNAVVERTYVTDIKTKSSFF